MTAPALLTERDAATRKPASWITRSPDMMAGAYCIRGMRMPIRAIRHAHRHGWSAEKIMAEWPCLTRADIECALAFRAKR